jgi:N-methylhydantoinase A
MKLGIDIGGTFTDLVLLDETGRLVFGKTLTTYPDPAEGILTGVEQTLRAARVEAHALRGIVHGTTLVTNAVIERKGAKTGLITTEGFEDVLEIGRELRYDIYDIFLTMPEPLAPRDLRVGVVERMDKNGRALTPLDEESVRRAAERLLALGVESVAVVLLHAYANDEHERKIGAFLRERHPELYCSLSCEVMPEIREYERSSATVMNAYVQPITDEYLRNLGFTGSIHIMISSGRLTTIGGAREKPILLLESGPAGGAMAAVFFGKLTGQADLLAFDMGGATAKACLVKDGKPEVTNQFEAARVRRFKKGSGLPVRIPVIDLIEIGAGGGSIARVNHLGLLTVGPDSAASQPGPACYGQGGEHPTVTDADLILGYLNPDYFLGGAMRLDRDLAVQAIEQTVARPLGLSVEAAALGIHRVVNENMANAARVHILEKGFDPRRFTMLAFGGAGPVHAFQVARLLRAPRLIIPVGAGVTSALGFLVSPVASEQIASWVCPLDGMDWDKLNEMLENMEREGIHFLETAGIHRAKALVSRLADMRYLGQGHEICVPIPNGRLEARALPLIVENFKREYRLRYGRDIARMPIESVTWRVVVCGPNPELAPRRQGDEVNDGLEALLGHRSVFFPETDGRTVNCPVYQRYRLRPGDRIEGPAIIEERESTAVIGPNSRVSLDEHNNLVVDLYY